MQPPSIAAHAVIRDNFNMANAKTLIQSNQREVANALRGSSEIRMNATNRFKMDGYSLTRAFETPKSVGVEDAE